MNRIFLSTAIVVFLVLSSCNSMQNDSKKTFNNLHWLEGKWKSNDVTNYTEIWKRVNDTCYEGLSLNSDASDSLVEERPKIVMRHNSILFVSEIEEQTVEGLTRDFALKSSSPDSLVFTNNAANYPNMITYKKISDTTLKVRMDRKSSDGLIQFEYTLQKIK